MTFKQKLENYWYYYKWHTVFGSILLAGILFSAVQCAQSVKPDLRIAYIAEKYVPTEDFQNDAAKIVGDVNSDGKEYVFCDNITVSKEIKSEMDLTVREKIMVLYASGETKLFIAQPDVLLPVADGFEDLSGILPGEKLEGALEKDGAKIAVSAAQCPLLEKYGLADDNLYVAVLSLWDDKDKPLYDASVKLIKEMAK